MYWQLTAHDADERLHGAASQNHPFFTPLCGMWAEIAAQRHPPFVNVVWPEVDDDTRLDLRAYSDEDMDDSFGEEDSAHDWFAELAEIPVDSQQDLGPSHRSATPPGLKATDLAYDSPPAPHVDLDLDVLPLPSLSLLSTLPSSPSSLWAPAPMKETIPSLQLTSRVMATATPNRRLRRRHVVHDLREAFHLAGITFVSNNRATPYRRAMAGKPSFYPTSTPSKMRRRCKSGLPDVRDGASMSFEHQITIALLATMGSKSGAMATGASSVASLHAAPPSVAYKAGPPSRRGTSAKVKVWSALRKLKSLVL